MILYLGVTADKYELPLYVCESPDELAKIMGISGSAVRSSISKNSSGRNRGIKFVKVEIDEEEE